MVSRNGWCRAFTLIELIIVIAIIALLIAILIPVFSHARERSLQSACVSNTKQIGLAIVSYMQDFNGYLPQADGKDPSMYVIAARVQPYLKDFSVFKCPSSLWQQGAIQLENSQGTGCIKPSCILPPDDHCIGLPHSEAGEKRLYDDVYPPTDYAMNQSLYYWQPSDCGGKRLGYGAAFALDAGQITSVSKCALAIDYPPATFLWPGEQFWEDHGARPHGRHFDGATVIFADGHSRWAAYSELYPEGVQNSAMKNEWVWWGFKGADKTVQ